MTRLPVSAGARRVADRVGPAGAALVAICVAGAVARLVTLDLQSLWYDESVTAQRVIYPSFADTAEWVWNHENHPPLWYLIEWIWIQLAGKGEVALRLPAAVAGAAMIPLGYVIGRELDGRRTGLVLAALIAVQPLLFWYSQEARPYSLYAFFAALSFWAFIRAARSGSPRDLAFWAGASVLALLSHFFAVFPVAAEGAWLLFAHRRSRPAWLAVGGVAGISAGLIPVIRRAQDFVNNDWIAMADFGDRAHYVLSSPFNGLVREQRPLAVAALIGAAILVTYAVRKSSPERRWAYGACVAIALGAVVLPLGAVALGSDFYLQRNLIAWIVPLLAALAIAISNSPRPVAIVAAVALIAVSTVPIIRVFTDPDERREGWAAAVDYLRSQPEPAEVVVGGPLSWGSLDYYLGRREITSDRVVVRRLAVAAWPEPRPEWLPGSFREVEKRRFDGPLIVRVFQARRPTWVSIPPADLFTEGSFYIAGPVGQ